MRPQTLSAQIVLPLSLAVIAGSLALVGWLSWRTTSDSRAAFREQAAANARFIKRSHLPPSDKLARDLSAVLDFEVTFGPWDAFGDKQRRSPGEVVRAGLDREVVLLRIAPDTGALFARPRPSFGESLARGSTLVPLAVFWGGSLLLATFLSRRLVRPIVSLAGGVGALEATQGAPAEFPGAARRDEIGSLARALSQTHARLIEERSKREEGERAAMLGRMATGLAHEIKNPVAAIRLHAQLLDGCDRCAESAQTIAGEADAVESLVNQWMFLARPEPPERREQDLAAILDRCLAAAEPAAEHAGVTLVRRYRGQMRAEVDAARIAQAVRNLVTNGLHAMPDGGELEISVTEIDGAWHIRFADQGRGFGAEALERWSEPFFSTKEGGMGLGLSVASEVAFAHGGTLRVENRERGGAVVSLQIPIPR